MLKRNLGLLFVFSFLTTACGSSGEDIGFPTSQIKTKIISSEVISGAEDATLVTFAEEKKLKRTNLRIRIPDQGENHTSIVAVKSGEEIKLLDFFVSEINEQPQLSFESTARSLVFLNPLFSSIPFEKQSEIFTDISNHEKFNNLVDHVSKMQSISDENIVELSTDIAIDIAQKHLQTDIDMADSLSNSSQAAQAVSSQEQSNENMFSSTSFPLDSCGDSLPTSKDSYPVNMYPVYIDLSEENLQGVKSKFCRDAYEKLRDDGTTSIQVSSFSSQEKANAFKNLMIQNFGSGEVGEPTVIEEPRASLKQQINNIYSSLKDLFSIPKSYAQSPLDIREFSINENFKDRAKVFFPAMSPLALGHWVDLAATEKGISVFGTSFAAQQIIVVPASKYSGKIHRNDYAGHQKEEDIVAEYFIEPAELGVWDFKALYTFSNNLAGEPNFTHLLSPKKSSIWEPGEYVILMSGGPFINRRTPERFYGAFDLNSAIYLTDLYGTMSSLSDVVNVHDLASAIAKAGVGCVTKENPIDLIICLAGQDNVVAVFQAFGGEADELLTELFRFQGESAKILAKRMANTINVFEKGLSISRMAFLGADYFRQINEELYMAKFSVTAPPPDPTLLALSEITDINDFEKVNINCNSDPVGQFQDLEFQRCGNTAFGAGRFVTAKNYSSNWYEISLTQQINGEDHLNSFLIGPGEDGNFSIVDASGLMMNALTDFDMMMNALNKDDTQKLNTVKLANSKVLQIKKHTNLPSTSVTVNCNHEPFSIWNIKVTPKCTSQGTYVDLEGIVKQTIHIQVGNDTLIFEPSIVADSASITSSNSSVNFQLFIP